MKMWLLTQSECTGYDTYDSVVVAASTAEKAKRVAPSWDESECRIRWSDQHGGWFLHRKDGTCDRWSMSGSWPDITAVEATLIGTAVRGTQEGVVLASFHAG